MLLILSGFMSIAKCVPGIISFPFLSFLFLSKEQHGAGEVRFCLWVLIDFSSGLNSASDILCDRSKSKLTIAALPGQCSSWICFSFYFLLSKYLTTAMPDFPNKEK